MQGILMNDSSKSFLTWYSNLNTPFKLKEETYVVGITVEELCGYGIDGWGI
jgi:hypothetical protein